MDVAEGFDIGYLLRYAAWQAEAAEAAYQVVALQVGNRRGRMRPMLRRFDPTGSTEDVFFRTRKATVETQKSEVSHVTLDGIGGNTWEQILALECEANPEVEAYVKNEHLGFTIPYIHQGRTDSYVPDFLLRLKRRDEGDVVRTLIRR